MTASFGLVRLWFRKQAETAWLADTGFQAGRPFHTKSLCDQAKA
jgi:hypothetical protein